MAHLQNRTVKISTALQGVLGLESASVTPKRVNDALTAYVKEHDLAKGQKFDLSGSNYGLKLQTAIGIPPMTNVTYFSVQKFLHQHYKRQAE